MNINIKGKGLEIIPVDQGDNNNAYFVDGMLSALSYFGKIYVAVNWKEFKDYYGRNAIFNGKGAFLNNRAANAFVKKFGHEGQQYIDEALDYLASIEEKTKENTMKIILKEGQEVLDVQGNRYLIEKGDTVKSIKESLDASVWSKELHGEKATSFDYLEINQKFVFPNSDEINIKVGNTKYKDSKGHTFTTGKGSSVIRITEKGDLLLEKQSYEKDVLKGFLEAALFTGTNGEGDSIDNLTIRDFDKESLRKAEKIVKEFLLAVYSEPTDIVEGAGKGMEELGHDLWMTITHQGAGFWDGDWGDFEDELVDVVKRVEKKNHVEGAYSYDDESIEIM